MDVTKKQVCLYGVKCYRKNKTHSKEFSHPSVAPISTDEVKNDETLQVQSRTDSSTRDKVKVITHQDKGQIFLHRDARTTKRKKNVLNDKTGSKLATTCKRVKKLSVKKQSYNEGRVLKKNNLSKNKNKTLQNSTEKLNQISDNSDDEYEIRDIKSSSWTYIKAPTESKDLSVKSNYNLKENEKDFIKLYYLVEMPPDFYCFYDFCKSIDSNKPLDILMPFNLKLVGPYDILMGKEINLPDKELMLCHWRFFYDPPEFQTVLAADSGFHIGYWRDSPHDMPIFMANNNPKDGCQFKIEAENIFGAVHHYLSEYIKKCEPFTKIKASKFQGSLIQWAEKKNYSLEKMTSKMKSRQKKISSKTFHGAGIVVPVKKQVGYRPLIETDASIKKICKLIMNAQTADERDTLMEKLQPLITAANIANDEGDFGNSLELGIDLFCMGSNIFNNMVEHLLGTAYTLLDRDEFGQIIKVHLRNRQENENVNLL